MGTVQVLPTLSGVLMVAIGGALGAVARYGLSGWVHHYFPSAFPWGTLTVNSLGSFVLGFLAVFFAKYFTEMDLVRLLLITGFLGAFTTFSTFSYQSVVLIQQGKLLLAGSNIVANVTICCVFAGLGVWFGQRV